MQQTIWYPYAQMKQIKPYPEVTSAQGVYLHLSDGRKLIDAIASWWTVLHGYNHPELNQAANEQIVRFAHVMLGGLTHPQAKALAEKLVQITPEGLDHVFFSDSGSVGVEVALKMAIQYWHNRNKPQKKKILALKRAYHGDTCGAMSVGDPENSMHNVFSPLLPVQCFLEEPRSGFDPGPDELKKEIDQLNSFITGNHEQLAGFIVEPLMQGAGGFNFYPPQYLQAAREVCNRYDVLLIFDEVATGFGRCGTLFAADKAGVAPDIMVLGKALTAGYFGQSATLATTKIFEGFYGEDESSALMHGPTFMANATACAVALKSIEIFEREHYLDKIAHIEEVLRTELLSITSEKIRDTRVLGAVGVIEVHDKQDLEGIQDFAIERGVWLRPFQNCVYTLPPFIITDDQMLTVIHVMKEWFGSR